MILIENTPKTWRAPKLGDLCEIIGGKAAPQIDSAFTDAEDGLPFVRMKDLGRHHFSNNLTDYSERITPAYAKAHGYTTVPKGTILMPRSGSVALNHRAILGRDSVIVSHICGLKIKVPEVDTGYLYRLLCRIDMRKICKKTTGLDSIAFSDLAQVRIPLPELAEQKRIAGILDAADALRAQRRRSIALLDDLARSLFLHHFGDPVSNPKGWPMVTIGEVSNVQGGLQVSTARSVNPLEVPYLRVANVHRGFLNLDEIKTLRATESEIGRTALRKNDLLVVEGHGNPNEIGRCALWNDSVAGAVHQNHLIRVRFDTDRVIPAFGCDYLNSPGGRRHLLRAGKTTSGLNTISVSEVRTAPVALPPLDLQRRFASELAVVETMKAHQRTHLAKLDTLFASLQNRAFSGRL